MNVKRLLYSDFGRIVISILLGFGFACLFYKVCNDKNCIVFQGPVIDQVDGKVFEYGDKCYKYSIKQHPCDPEKQTVYFRSATQND